MKYVLAALLLVALVCFAVAVENKELDQDIKVLYQTFLSKYNKVYATNIQEVEKRFKIFQQNVEKARAMNKKSSSESYGISPFMDLSAEEFRARYLSKSYSRSELAKKMGITHETMDVPKGANEPDSYNWADNGAVTPIKNQGQCGSCWAFSTTGNVEGLYFLKTKKLVALSEQQLVDCDHQCEPNNPQSCDSGCNGGLMDNALRYVMDKGLESENDYAYQAVDMTCKYDASKVVTRVTNSTILPNDADKIKSYLLTHGPLAVALNAEWLQTYTGGISDPWMCDAKALDHGVLIVGYGKGKNWFGTEKEYWIVKNSWSSSWGEKGYFRIVRGSNKCGIESYATSGVEAVPVA
mmetsp:Transcript_4695/g.6946  ORF Transcript_4695/g.6946 Transcript_4695/m.6946 type:complete len:352 (-) Transcript_4695:47-1102(-)|eukprot:CAMPEP_0117419530 /NCGR_PEP_ID=MMETSP0758-20121206/1068_1 /TAXON_ID=63605 /ORGANISM="Percolomonas cosmopolitus, Strain AE-1 (ATCC 50343)" /LENGTH=351 /DNA_ID=CAMNT_0005200639 /DNA_START=1 /DNA_END=1056 /DNA_ORIENTATION=-